MTASVRHYVVRLSVVVARLLAHVKIKLRIEQCLIISTATLSNAQNLGYLATSPPAWSSTPQQFSSPIDKAAQSNLDSFTDTNNNQRLRDAQLDSDATLVGTAPNSSTQEAPINEAREETTAKPYVSKIGILTSSLPMYHNQLMDMRRKDQRRRHATAKGESLEPEDMGKLSKLSLNTDSGEQTSEEQAETARHLKPFSRSTAYLQAIAANAPRDSAGVVIMTPKTKGNRTKWQFGIRSKSEPLDAIKCLYKALGSMGDCQWQVAELQQNKPRDGAPYPVNVAGATHLTAAESTLSESPEKDKHHIQGNHSAPANDPQDSSSEDNAASEGDHVEDQPSYEDDSDSENDDDVDINHFPPGYIPKDPWCIHVRWEKKGMSPPSVADSTSATSSRIDLNGNDGSGRRGSLPLGTLSSAAGSTTSVAGAEPVTENFDDTACFVYLDLQIYVLELETYLVDFKCAGYESIIGEHKVVNKKGEEITEFIGSGHRVADKDVTSPQPFLDLANKLVIHLARGGG